MKIQVFNIFNDGNSILIPDYECFSRKEPYYITFRSPDFWILFSDLISYELIMTLQDQFVYCPVDLTSWIYNNQSEKSPNHTKL